MSSRILEGPAKTRMMKIDATKKAIYFRSRSINIDSEYIEIRNIMEQYGTSVSGASSRCSYFVVKDEKVLVYTLHFIKISI